MEQTVRIMTGKADGLCEADGTVAALQRLPRWLQMFLLACKEPFKEEHEQLGAFDGARFGFPRTICFDDANAFSDLFQKLVENDRLDLEELKELAIEECDAERYRREEDDGEGCEEDEEEDEEGQKEYYVTQIREAIDAVAGNSVDCTSIETIVESMEDYKDSHSVLMSPFLLVRIDHSNIGTQTRCL